MIKSNWGETRERFIEWWNRRGVILGQWGFGVVDESRSPATPRPVYESLEARHTDPEYLTDLGEWELARRTFPADTLPLACPGLQTVELASYLGAGLTFDAETIWYQATETDPADWDVRLDETNRWLRRMTETLTRQADAGRDRYLAAFPGIAPNLDVVAELRGTERLMFDLVERPELVRSLLDRIDELYFEVYDRYYRIISQPDGGSAFYYFMLWGPGRVTQLQCDVAAMISPRMFDEFVRPGLVTACDRIDHTLFHVDGPPMLKHLDSLLSIDSLDAIEFTPGPGVPTGADPYWYGMYRRVLDAGKSIQVVVSELERIEPLLETLGANGVYLLTVFNRDEQFLRAIEIVSRFRG